MSQTTIPSSPRRRRGAILIVAMLVVFALAALALTLGSSIRAESSVSANNAASRAASLAARAGEQYALALLSQVADQPIESLDESDFEAVPVGAGGYFWIVRPDYADEAMPRFGLVDESSKIDLNRADYERLRLLAGATDEIAASIVDWRDEDDEPTDGIGAESSVYLTRTPEAHAAKNAPFESVEELRMIEGMTDALLHGEGEPGDDDRGVSAAIESEAYVVSGLYDYFTIWGAEATTSLDGQPRLDLGNPEQSEQVLELLITTFGDSRGGEMASRLGNATSLDLFDFARRTEMTTEELLQVEDRLIMSGGTLRLNVNTASREALLTLAPELEADDVDAVVARRADEVVENPGSMAWVLEALEDRAIGLGRLLTARGRYWSADIVSASANGRAFRRVRIVFDTSQTPPRPVYRRDISERGWPLEASILDALRAGEQPTTMGAITR